MDKQKKKKEPYEKPKIIYEKELEVQAAVCDSVWLNDGITCQSSAPCIRLRT